MKSSAQKLTAKYGFQPSTGFDTTVAREGSYLTNKWHLGSLFSLKQFEIGSSKAKLDNMNQPKHKSIYIFMRCNIGRNLYFQLWNGAIELPVYAPPGPGIHFPFRTGSMGGGKSPFHDFYFPYPPAIWVVYFYHCITETASAPQTGALTGQTNFYLFLPSQRKNFFFWLLLLQPAATN